MGIQHNTEILLYDTEGPLLSSTFNAVNFSIAVIDDHGFYSEVNDAYCQMMGYSREELVGHHFLTIVPQEQQKSFLQIFNRMIHTTDQTQFAGEYVSQRKDGHIFEVLAHTCVITRPSGIRSLIVSVIDISENKKYKYLLEETELATGVGGWQLDMRTNLLSCTEGMYKLFNLPHSTYISLDDMLSFFGNESYQLLREALQMATEKGEPFNLELSCCAKPGRPKWIRAIGRADRILNQTVQLFGTFQDITQHKEAEELIYLGQAKYRAIANSSLYAFILGKPDGTILEVNTKAKELFGYTDEEFKRVGRAGAVLNTPELEKLLSERVSKGFAQGELIGIKKNGDHFPCEFSSVYFKDLNGEDRMSTIMFDISEKKKNEEELKKLSHIARETLCPIVITDVDRRIQWVNAAFTRAMEYTFKEAVGKRPEDFLYGKETDPQAIYNFIENKRNGRTFESEMLMYTKSGKKIWITLQAQPQLDKQGKVVGYFAIGIDSTVRKQTEEQMLRNQQLLQQAEQLALLGSWEIDIKTGNSIWSDEMYRIYGWEPGEITPTLERQLASIHPDDMDMVLAAMQATIEGKGDFDIERRIVQPNGNIRIIHSHGQLIRNRLGEPEKVIGMAHDITSQKQAESQLRQQEADMIAAIENIPDIVFSTDLNGNLLTFNSASRRMAAAVGVKLERGINMLEKWPRNKQELMPYYQRALKGERVAFEARLIFNNGTSDELVFFDISMNPVLDEKKHQIGISVFCRNITERIGLERQLMEEKVNRQRQIARATINTQERERSEIGKELHDNVNQILASAKLFLSSPFIEGDEREKFTGKAVDHINMAIEEIRKLSKSLVSPSAADLGIIETINDMIADIRITRKMDIRFNYGSFDESTIDNGLKLTIYRIIQEQVNNILKYADASSFTISIKDANNQLILTITDNGKGFDYNQKRKGIGLNNIINRADVFNGKVTIRTAPGEGCRVRVVFDK
jgi:PAS domain S-box-containing protein